MKKVLFYFALIMCITSVAFGQQKIAVYAQRENTSGFDQGTKDFVVAEFVKALNGGQYTAVNREREFAEIISREIEYQQSGFVSDEQIAKLGKQSGVSLVCVITFRKVLGQQNIEARIIDVETAEIINSENRTVNNATITTLQNDIVAIAKTLLGDKGVGKVEVRSANELLMFDKRYSSRIAGYSESKGEWSGVHEDAVLRRMRHDANAYQLYVDGKGMIDGWRNLEGMFTFMGIGGLVFLGGDWVLALVEELPIFPPASWAGYAGWGMLGIGVGYILATECIVVPIGNSKIKKAVKIYNDGQRFSDNMTLKIGLAPNGFGLALNF